jgi:hypothetical protein
MPHPQSLSPAGMRLSLTLVASFSSVNYVAGFDALGIVWFGGISPETRLASKPEEYSSLL